MFIGYVDTKTNPASIIKFLYTFVHRVHVEVSHLFRRFFRIDCVQTNLKHFQMSCVQQNVILIVNVKLCRVMLRVNNAATTFVTGLLYEIRI